jgi:hypothetical protein
VGKEFLYKRKYQKNIEIQLLDDFYNENFSFKDTINQIREYKLDIGAVHTPLTSNKDVEINNFCYSK